MLVNHQHLSYCTNIHAGESWPQALQSLAKHVPPIKAALAPKQDFGLGLRLSAQAAQQLRQPKAMAHFKQWLQAEGLYVFTMNGFPYGGFHHTHVKDAVHQPDWTSPDRLRYTLQLFDILSKLLPQGAEGGISTSPLSYKPWAAGKLDLPLRYYERVYQPCSQQLALVAAALYRIEQEQGQYLHLDIEPEPDGLLENTADTIYAFKEWIWPAAAQHLAHTFGLSPQAAADAARRYLCLCYDVCHFAVAFENHAQSLQHFAQEGLRIGKFQISAALRAALSSPNREIVLDELARFNEPTYLHQVVAQLHDGSLRQFRDLPDALASAQARHAREWRVHFHVPIFIERYQHLQATQPDIIDVLQLQTQHRYSRHLEVETYTWEVLPDALRLDLTASIVREIDFVRQHLTASPAAPNLPK